MKNDKFLTTHADYSTRTHISHITHKRRGGKKKTSRMFKNRSYLCFLSSVIIIIIITDTPVLYQKRTRSPKKKQRNKQTKNNNNQGFVVLNTRRSGNTKQKIVTATEYFRISNHSISKGDLTTKKPHISHIFLSLFFRFTRHKNTPLFFFFQTKKTKKNDG